METLVGNTCDRLAPAGTHRLRATAARGRRQALHRVAPSPSTSYFQHARCPVCRARPRAPDASAADEPPPPETGGPPGRPLGARRHEPTGIVRGDRLPEESWTLGRALRAAVAPSLLAVRGWWALYGDILQRLAVNVAVLAIYRAGHFIALPGVDPALLPPDFALGGDFFKELFNVVETPANIFTLGIGPYIEASILISVALTPWVLDSCKPYIPFGRELARWKDQGREGHTKIKLLIKSIALFAALFEGYMKGCALQKHVMFTQHAVLTTMLNLTAGTFIQLWLADLVSHRGLGEGISYLICLNMVSGFSTNLDAALTALAIAPPPPGTVAAIIATAAAFAVAFLLLGTAVVYLPVASYRARASRAAGALPGHLKARLQGLDVSQRMKFPIKLNENGIMPIIFSLTAIQAVQAGATWAGAAAVSRAISDCFYAVHAVLILQFSLSSLASSSNSASISDYLSKSNAGIVDVPPGAPTIRHLDAVCLRTRLLGGAALAALAVSAELFDRACLGAIGASLQTTNLLLLSGFVSGAVRQSASLTRGPATKAALDREAARLGLGTGLAL